MLQFARILRQQSEQKTEVRQTPIHPTYAHASNQYSKTFARSSTNKNTKACNMRCGSSLLAIGIIMLVVGLRIGGILFVVIGPICSVFGLIFLFVGMDRTIRGKEVSSGKKINVVALQRKEAIQGLESDTVEADERRKVLLKPYVVTEVECSPVFDRAGRFQIDVSDSGSLYVVGLGCSQN